MQKSKNKISYLGMITIIPLLLTSIFFNYSKTFGDPLKISTSGPVSFKKMEKLGVKANDTIYDPNKNLIYVSVSETSENFPNTILVLNANPVTVNTTIPLSSEPNQLGIANDGSMLYVGMDKIESIQRVNLNSQTQDILFPLGETVNTQDPVLRAIDMVVVQDKPNTVIVSMKGQWDNFYGTKIYEDGVQMEKQIDSYSNVQIEPSELVTKVYGYDSETTLAAFSELLVSDDGLEEISSNYDLFRDLTSSYLKEIKFKNQYIYTSIGAKIDPVNKSVAGHYQLQNSSVLGPVAISPNSERVAYVTPSDKSTFDGSGELMIVIYHQKDFRLLGKAYLDRIDTYQELNRPIELEFLSDSKLLLLTEQKDLYLVDVEILGFQSFLPTTLKDFQLPLFSPGIYPMTDKCTEIPIKDGDELLARVDMCATSVEVLQNGDMKFNISWTSYFFSNQINFLRKGSDVGNTNMNVRDIVGNRYDHIGLGGAAAETTYWYSDGETHTGWYLFPAAETGATTFYFHDDDQGVIISDIVLKE